MTVSLSVGILIIAVVWSLPVLEVWLITKFIKWQEFRKRTFAGIEVSQEYLDRLNDRDDFWGDGDDRVVNMQNEINKIHNTRLNDYLNSKVKTIKQLSPDGSRELTLGYEKEGF